MDVLRSCMLKINSLYTMVYTIPHEIMGVFTHVQTVNTTFPSDYVAWV